MGRTPKKQKEKNMPTAIFIHSLYRTGSTYVWSKFRENKKYCCYYDPFHHNMGSIDTENPMLENLSIMNAHRLRHPVLDREYTDEYRKLLPVHEKGVPSFKKSFTADDYCNNNDNPEQKKYIDSLILGTENQVPLFKSNLSPLRSEWFKKNYPGALHLYLLRNPRNQFQSYLDMYEQEFPLFLVNDLIISGVNRKTDFFKPLASHIPLFEYHCEKFEDEYYIYRQLLPLYSDHEKYFIFYYIWLFALVENVLNSDIILNIDHIDTDRSYRTAVCEELEKNGATGIDFDDAVPWEYKKFTLKRSEFDQIEKTVESIVMRQYPIRKFELFNKRLEPHNKERFDLHKDTLSFLRQRELDPVNILQGLQEKHNRLFEIFSNQLLKLKRTITQPAQAPGEAPTLSARLEQELTQTRKELAAKIQSLQDKDRQIQQRDQQLADKKMELADKEEQWKQELETASKNLQEKEELLKRFQSRKEILDLVLQLHEKDQLLEQQEWEIKDKDLRLKQKTETYTENLAQKDESIKQKDELIGELKQQFAQNSEKLKELEQQLNQKQYQLAQKTQALEKNEKLLVWKDQQIAEKDQMLKKNESRIASLVKEKNMNMSQIEEKNKRIDSLTEEIKWLSSNKFISLIRRIFRPSI
jgi:hypothetical protein